MTRTATGEEPDSDCRQIKNIIFKSHSRVNAHPPTCIGGIRCRRRRRRLTLFIVR